MSSRMKKIVFAYLLVSPLYWPSAKSQNGDIGNLEKGNASSVYKAKFFSTNSTEKSSSESRGMLD